ncbi:MAG TPA: MFS transporter, partial [Actinomycetaceae bacterium]|nr:MFS transporter [Actinomycetaceae bacterium]
MRSTFASLSFFNYRLWFAGALVANIGTWMQRIAQDWLVLTILSDDSGLAIGIVTGLQFLPMLLLSPYGGLLADRLPRRQLLIATQSALGLLAAGLGVLVLSGVAELWHVYVFALMLGVVTALDNPVRQTFVAEMVPPASLPNAVGLNSASFNAARLIGPGISGLLIAVVGPGWIFIINALSFGATIFSLTLMRAHELHEMPHATRGKGQIR